MTSVVDFTKAMLALMMWRERGEDGLQGMIAVGQVIRNRAIAGWNGGDWCAVMWANGTDLVGVPWPDTRDPQFQAVLGRADSIYEGKEADLTGGGLYYAKLGVPDKLDPWFVQNILQKPEAHPRLGTVGQYTFFG